MKPQGVRRGFREDSFLVPGVNWDRWAFLLGEGRGHNQDLSREQTKYMQSYVREPEPFPIARGGVHQGQRETGAGGEAAERDGSGWARCHGSRQPLRGINKGIYILSGEDGSGRNEEKGAP